MRRFPWLLALCVVWLSGGALAEAQPSDTSDLAVEVRAQFEVSPITGGVALLPRDRDLGIAMITLRGGAVYLDGDDGTVDAAQLAARLGADAAPILRLMYLDAAAQRTALGLPALGPDEETAPGREPEDEDAASTPAVVRELDPPQRERSVTRRDIVRFGGNVHVEVDELVRGDVVVIGGSLVVDGEVRGEITVVGGSATFGPESVATREVTVVGGSVRRAPGSRFSRGINEVSFDAVDFDFSDLGLEFGGLPTIRIPRPDLQFFRSLDLVGTLIRLGFFGLLGSVVVLLAFALVGGMVLKTSRSSRAWSDSWRSCSSSRSS